MTKSFIDKRISVLSRSLKQNISLSTEITTENEVIIDGQFIGKLKGLRLNLDFKSGSLDADIKSLKKAARQAIAPELMRRVTKILKCKTLRLDADHKIYWMESPIAYITSGKDYLYPNLKIIVDDAIDLESKVKLQSFLAQWIGNLIKNELYDLVNLKDVNHKSGYTRALCFQLFEKNGILKRESVKDMIKNLSKEDRFFLRKMGVKIGRISYFPSKNA